MPDTRELMLILGANSQAQDVLGNHWVAQKVSPRVVIIQPSGEPAETKKNLQATEGVQAVLEPGETASEEIRGKLTPNEKLFVDAYGRRSQPKQRRGEGLAWDAKEFLTPDKPKHT